MRLKAGGSTTVGKVGGDCIMHAKRKSLAGVRQVYLFEHAGQKDPNPYSSRKYRVFDLSPSASGLGDKASETKRDTDLGIAQAQYVIVNVRT